MGGGGALSLVTLSLDTREEGKYSLLAAAWPCVPDDAYGPTGGEAAEASALTNDPVLPSSAGEGGGVPAPDGRNGDKNGTFLNRPVLTHGMGNG